MLQLGKLALPFSQPQPVKDAPTSCLNSQAFDQASQFLQLIVGSIGGLSPGSNVVQAGHSAASLNAGDAGLGGAKTLG
jgi:hypothetical protein